MIKNLLTLCLISFLTLINTNMGYGFTNNDNQQYEEFYHTKQGPFSSISLSKCEMASTYIENRYQVLLEYAGREVAIQSNYSFLKYGIEYIVNKYADELKLDPELTQDLFCEYFDHLVTTLPSKHLFTDYKNSYEKREELEIIVLRLLSTTTAPQIVIPLIYNYEDQIFN